MKAGVAVLALLVAAVAADLNGDMWQNYADQMRGSFGLGDDIKNNPDFAVAIAGKSSMTLLGNDIECVHNAAVATIGDSAASTNNPIFVPGSGGFFSAYKLFVGSIKPKTTNNPSLIPQLAKDKQNFMKLQDSFSNVQGEVFTKYAQYKEAIGSVKGSRPLDLISWRAKYYPKYKMMEDSVSAAKTKIDTAEALLWGSAYIVIQDAKKKIEMAESAETYTGNNMRVCPGRTQKLIADYENPDNWANPTPPASTEDDQEFFFRPGYYMQTARNMLDEMRNAALHQNEGETNSELSVKITKARAQVDASKFGFSSWGGVFTPFFFIGGAVTGQQAQASASAGYESVTINFAGHRLITIEPAPWYDGALVKQFWNSLYPGAADVLFGPKGVFNFVPRQAMMVYNPSFRIEITRSNWAAYERTIAGFGHGAIPFTIGPFAVVGTFAGAGGAAGSNAKYENGVLEVKTYSDSLFLAGVVGEKIVSAGKSFLNMLGEEEASFNFDEEEDDDSKNFWKSTGAKAKDNAVVSTGSEEPLTFDLKNVQVQKGEVKFAFSPQGFNVDKTDDAVFSAQLNLKRDNRRKIA